MSSPVFSIPAAPRLAWSTVEVTGIAGDRDAGSEDGARERGGDLEATGEARCVFLRRHAVYINARERNSAAAELTARKGYEGVVAARGADRGRGVPGYRHVASSSA